MGYWDATDDYLRTHGGCGPTCGFCGNEKFPIDDHGRFGCFCGGASIGGELGMSARRVAQIYADNMSDAEKAAIPPINRLNAPPTAAEAAVLEMLLQGPDAMGNPTYTAACEALDKERGKSG